jgi:hypothetical protein
MEEVTEDELKEVLHIFQKDKIPRPDDWTIEYFLGFYDLPGEDILQVVEESRREGVLHAPLNSTFKSLIPKSDNPQFFEEFPPISLYNCIYKIVEKIIARRLKPILYSSIYREQFFFLEGI